MSRSLSRQKEPTDDTRKVFITNIDGKQPQDAVQSQLRKLFQPYGPLNKLNVKKNKNGLYSFAFLQFQQGQNAAAAIKELDQYELFGKRMRVRQDRQNDGCFHCKKTGHFARQCPQNKEGPQQKRQFNNRPKYENKNIYQRYDRPRDTYKDRNYNDRYRNQRNYDRERERERPYREERDRREYQYRRSRKSPSQLSRSRSDSRQYRHRRDKSVESRSNSYERNRYEHSKRRYYERRPQERDRHRDDHRNRRRDSSYSRSHSYSRSRSSGR